MYPNVQLRPLILFPFKHFGGGVRRAATPCRQRLACIVKVPESKVCKTQADKQQIFLLFELYCSERRSGHCGLGLGCMQFVIMIKFCRTAPSTVNQCHISSLAQKTCCPAPPRSDSRAIDNIISLCLFMC